jgi:hypothetical protein
MEKIGNNNKWVKSFKKIDHITSRKKYFFQKDRKICSLISITLNTKGQNWIKNDKKKKQVQLNLS